MRGRFHGKGVRPAARFRQAKGRNGIGGQSRQPPVLQLFGSPKAHRIVRQSVVNVHENGHGGIDAGDFFHRQAGAREIEARAAVCGRNLQTEKALREERIHNLGRQVRGLVHGADLAGRQFGGGPLADGVAGQELVFGKGRDGRAEAAEQLLLLTAAVRTVV